MLNRTLVRWIATDFIFPFEHTLPPTEDLPMNDVLGGTTNGKVKALTEDNTNGEPQEDSIVEEPQKTSVMHG